MKFKSKTKKPKSELKKAEKKAWDAFSIMIRVRDADEWGYCTCITCTHRAKWREFDAGHFLPAGSCRGVKWNETNVHSQCGQCNRFKEGNRLKYREVMIKRYGQQHVDELEIAGRGSGKKTIWDYRIMEMNYKTQAQEIAKEKGLTI